MKKVLCVMSPIIMVCAIIFQSVNAKGSFTEAGDSQLELSVDTVYRQQRMYFKEGTSISRDQFLKEYGLELGLWDDDSLGLYKSEEDALGFKHYRYYQYHNGIKVEGAVYQIHEKNNSICLAHGLVVKGIKAPSKPIFSEKEALGSALESIDASLYAWQDTSWENDIKNELKDADASWFPKGSLVYYAWTEKNNDMSDGTNYRLAYKFIVKSLDPFDNIVVYVDSETAECLGKGSLIRNANGTVATVYNGTKSVTTLYRGFPNYDYVLRDQNTASEIITRNMEYNLWGDIKSF